MEQGLEEFGLEPNHLRVSAHVLLALEHLTVESALLLCTQELSSRIDVGLLFIAASHGEELSNDEVEEAFPFSKSARALEQATALQHLGHLDLHEGPRDDGAGVGIDKEDGSVDLKSESCSVVVVDDGNIAGRDEEKLLSLITLRFCRRRRSRRRS